MKKILRFYVQLEGDILKPVPNQKIEDILPDFTLNCIKEDVNFFEVKYNLDELAVVELQPIDTDYIRAEAINAAIDHNEALLTSLKEVPTAFDEREKVELSQQFVERIFKYGDAFSNDPLVRQLFDKFPIKKTILPITNE